MPVYPGARWEPIGASAGRGSNGAFRPGALIGFVLHCNAAESLDLHNFELSNLETGPTSHFQVTNDGTVYQYIDTGWTSWCQGDGNDAYLSIESQGLATEAATPQQVAAIGAILAWGRQVHGIPLLIANRPGEPGLGFHGMGAAAGQDWGHSVCPGVRGNPFLYPTQDQRPSMLAAAGAAHVVTGGGTPITNPTSEDDDMPLNDADKAWISTAINTGMMAVVNGSGYKIAGVGIDQTWDATKEAHDRKVIANGDSAADKAITDPVNGVLIRVAQLQAAVAALDAGSTGTVNDVPAQVQTAVTAALSPVMAAIQNIPAALAAALTKGAA